jgi:hypothetical protein
MNRTKRVERKADSDMWEMSELDFRAKRRANRQDRGMRCEKQSGEERSVDMDLVVGDKASVKSRTELWLSREPKDHCLRHLQPRPDRAVPRNKCQALRAQTAELL